MLLFEDGGGGLNGFLGTLPALWFLVSSGSTVPVYEGN